MKFKISGGRLGLSESLKPTFLPLFKKKKKEKHFIFCWVHSLKCLLGSIIKTGWLMVSLKLRYCKRRLHCCYADAFREWSTLHICCPTVPTNQCILFKYFCFNNVKSMSKLFAFKTFLLLPCQNIVFLFLHMPLKQGHTQIETT